MRGSQFTFMAALCHGTIQFPLCPDGWHEDFLKKGEGLKGGTLSPAPTSMSLAPTSGHLLGTAPGTYVLGRVGSCLPADGIRWNANKYVAS